MPNIIFLRVGDRDRLPLRAFIDSLSYFLGILRDFDAAISKDPHGTAIWEVVSLQQKSPPVVGVSPDLKHGKLDISDTIERQIIETTNHLTMTGERNPLVSDSALDKLESLARKAKEFGPYLIYVNPNGRPKQESQVTEKTLEKVQQITGIKYSAFGSITGELGEIFVHNKNEFRVWDEHTGKPVRCKFETPEQEKKIKDLLRSRVAVSGIVHSNASGNPVSLDMESLDVAIKRALPTIDEMRGLVEDFTGGKSLKEYLEEIAPLARPRRRHHVRGQRLLLPARRRRHVLHT
ncbi:MAG TPA: hypothetical protein VI685_15850, partial [Candidatus Angelobacter sp.]